MTIVLWYFATGIVSGIFEILFEIYDTHNIPMLRRLALFLITFIVFWDFAFLPTRLCLLHEKIHASLLFLQSLHGEDLNELPIWKICSLRKSITSFVITIEDLSVTLSVHTVSFIDTSIQLTYGPDAQIRALVTDSSNSLSVQGTY